MWYKLVQSSSAIVGILAGVLFGGGARRPKQEMRVQYFDIYHIIFQLVADLLHPVSSFALISILFAALMSSTICRYSHNFLCYD